MLDEKIVFSTKIPTPVIKEMERWGMDLKKAMWEVDTESLYYDGVVNFSGSDIEEIPIKFSFVGGNFFCSGCKNLKTLKNSPKEVKGSFYCNNCDSLISLEGSPNIVSGEFHCFNCKNLETLKGGPGTVSYDFCCWNCKKEFTEQDTETKTVMGIRIFDKNMYIHKVKLNCIGMSSTIWGGKRI